METCVICNNKFDYESTIVKGQGACTTCGAPYDIEGFNGRTETVSALSEKGIPLLKEYWNETKQYLGMCMFRPERPSHKGQEAALNRWIAKNHPEIPQDKK